MKILNIISLLATIVLLIGLVIASPIKPKNEFSLPSNAKEIAPGIYSLGEHLDNKGNLVEGYAIVHYKKGYEHRSGHTKGTTTSCYTFLASGAKWKTIEPWLVNPTNSESLDHNFILSNLALNIQKWENAAGKNILGIGSITYDALVADTSSTDGNNEVYFADISDSGAIGVTIVWGIFSGPTFNRKLVEWDQVYDDQDYNWSSSGELGKMDFENIATHELGHSVGLGDLYSLSCSNETMYGYASEGETNKRTLENGDITGIKKLYS